MKANLNSSKGVTLVALVITIVVLIILAGVAITLSIGDNGIFGRAKEATRDYSVKADGEARELENVQKQINEIYNEIYD